MLDHASLVGAKLDLEARGTPEGFTGWHVREGALPTYQLAFLMADYLVERRGFDELKRYFGSFARSRDRHRNFEVAFGTTLAAFEVDVLARLGVTVAATPALD